MTQRYRFPRKLTYLAIAGVLGSLSMDVFANDFAISNNGVEGQFAITNGSGFSGTATVNSAGTVTQITGVPLTSSFGIPNFAFTLANTDTTPTDGTHVFQVGVSIIDNSAGSNRRLEAFLGNLSLGVSGGGSVISGTIPNQSLNVIARAGSLTSSAILTNTLTNGPFVISGGSISFSGSNLVTGLLSSSVNNNAALFQNILEQFNLGSGSFTYHIAVRQVSGPDAATFGVRTSGVYGAFTPVALGATQFDLVGTIGGDNNYQVEAQFGGNAFVVTGTFTTAAVSSGGGGGGGTTTPPPTTDTPSAAQVNTGNQDLQNALAGGGPITTEIQNQATTVTNQAANLAQSLADSASSGTTIDAGTALTSLSTVSTSATTGGQVATGSTSASTQITLVDNSIRILASTATVLDALVSQGTQLTGAQSQQLETVVSNTLTTLNSMAETGASSTTQLAALARQANAITEAKAGLGIAATAAQVTQVETIGRKLAVAVINKVLTAAGQIAPTDAQITAAFNSNPQLLSSVIEASLSLPPTATEPEETTKNRILNAFRAANPTIVVSSSVSITPGVSPFSSFTFGSGSFVPGEVVTLVLTGENASGATLALSDGRQVLALSASEVTIAQDSVTGVVKITLPGESYSGTITGIKAVPATAPTGITFLSNGSVVIVRSGYAVELAPTTVDQLAFMAATLGAGYTPSFNTDNGTFSLALGGTQRFSGAFSYDNLTGKNLNTCGTISFTAPTGAPNSPGYAFVANCSTGGISQRITPFMDDADFFTSVTNLGYTTRVDRGTGIISVTGVGNFKPSFFVDARTAADTTFFNANKDSLDIAYQGGDFNGDGKADFKVISSSGVQLLYGL